jgi:hypothetical protein
MKCSNCGTENNEGTKFCTNCGNKLTEETNTPEEVTEVMNEEKEEVNNTVPVSQVVNNDNNPKKKNKWLTIGLPIAIVVIALIAIFGNGSGSSYSGGYGTTDAKTKFGNYLVNNGFTRNSSTNYTLYTSDGYLTTIDFSKGLMSMENSTIYSAYYYKEDVFGVAAVSSGTKIVVEYDYSTYNYTCTTSPSTYQSYACSYVKSSFVNLANTAKKTFNSLASAAGVSTWDL